MTSKIASNNKANLLQYGGAMRRRFGPLYLLSGAAFFFRKLRMDDRSADNIRRANERGPVVYVFHTKSKLDWLALNRMLNQRRLPLAALSHGMRTLWFRPVLDMAQQAWGVLRSFFTKSTETETLRTALLSGQSITVFLTRIQNFVSTDTQVLDQLFSLQKELDKPIQLVPIAVVWQRKPTKVRSDLRRFILGSEDQPGPLLKMLSVANRDHEPIVQAGEAVPLPEALERYASQPLKRQVRAVRLLLKRYLYRETHVIKGPKIRPYSWFLRQVLNAPEIKQLIQDETKLTGKSEERVRKEIEKNLQHIAARFNFRVLKMMAMICRFIWYRIFSGVDMREEDVERLRNAVREGTPILVPCHRSHLDYLLISSQCYEMGLLVPYIVAGENLSFFPMGYIFRSSGAFFIKRSFKKDRIFPKVFARYVKLLIREEIPMEFFIEGGRSRTGKLLYPRLGMLGMAVDSAVDIRKDRVISLLPIAVSYEQIAEEKAYARELSGEKKKKESVKGLLKASSVLKKRFGKVYIRIGEPILLNEIIARYDEPWKQMTQERKKEELQAIGEKIMFGIGRNMLILPTGITAMALLTESKGGVRLELIQERANRFDNVLRYMGAMSADSLTHGGWVVEEAMKRFSSEKWIERISDERGDIIRIVSESRITMEYYKNGLIHFMAPLSLLANAILANEDVCQGDDTLRYFLVAAFVFRYEFTTDPALDLEELAIQSREIMIHYGALEKDEAGKYSVRKKDLLKELAQVTHNFFEAYLWTLRGCLALQDRAITQKELPKKLQEYGKARLATGEIRRPESLSTVNISNAVKAFSEEGVLQFKAKSGYMIERDVWKHYVRDLERMLGGTIS